jgi:cytochrome c553
VKATVMYAVAGGLMLVSALAEAQQKSTPPELVTRVCSTCHGPRGISISPMFPNLAAQQPVYLETQLKAFRDRSRADPHAQAFMWGMAAQLTDAAITEIAAYYAAQPPAPGKPAGRDETAAGKKIFEEGIPAQQVPPCQSCHGDKAAGNGPFPRLAGQHRPYLERQLAAFISNARANEIMHANAKDLTALQISQIAAFLSGQQ